MYKWIALNEIDKIFVLSLSVVELYFSCCEIWHLEKFASPLLSAKIAKFNLYFIM